MTRTIPIQSAEDQAVKLLEKVARQLNRWAAESIAGGWSTHQVTPQKELAAEIHQFLDGKNYEH